MSCSYSKSMIAASFLPSDVAARKMESFRRITAYMSGTGEHIQSCCTSVQYTQNEQITEVDCTRKRKPTRIKNISNTQHEIQKAKRKQYRRQNCNADIALIEIELLKMELELATSQSTQDGMLQMQKLYALVKAAKSKKDYYTNRFHPNQYPAMAEWHRVARHLREKVESLFDQFKKNPNFTEKKVREECKKLYHINEIKLEVEHAYLEVERELNLKKYYQDYRWITKYYQDYRLKKDPNYRIKSCKLSKQEKLNKHG